MKRYDREGRDEFELIVKIVERGERLMERVYGEHPDLRGDSRSDRLMDIELAHEKCPLKLAEFLDADNSNFAHDWGGIRRHLNRETGELEDFFQPRFAR